MLAGALTNALLGYTTMYFSWCLGTDTAGTTSLRAQSLLGLRTLGDLRGKDAERKRRAKLNPKAALKELKL